jgi:type I restriction enzyme S subunit
MNWVSLRLGDVMEVKHGFAFKGEFFADSGEYVLLTPGNCHEGGGIKLRGDKEKYYLGDIPADYILGEGDILVVMTDLVGTAPVLGGAFVVPESDRFLHNQRLGLVQVTDASRIDRRFLYYLLNTHNYRAQIRGSASGATVRHTSPGRIQAAVLRIPLDTGYQRRVADTLSAYDDLIDNNRRRIKLLEDSVRLLFDEWFARLRFPGRAPSALIDGVPAGWSKVTLDQVLLLQRGFDLPSQDREAGEVPIYGSTGIVGFHNKAMVTGPGLVTGRSGSLGEVHFVARDFWPLNTALWVKEFKRATPLFALHLLRGMRLEQYNGGVSVPTLDRKVVHKAEVLLPPAPIVARFESVADDVYRQINTLSAMNEKLRTARDLLLPRLMSGELTV